MCNLFSSFLPMCIWGGVLCFHDLFPLSFLFPGHTSTLSPFIFHATRLPIMTIPYFFLVPLGPHDPVELAKGPIPWSFSVVFSLVSAAFPVL